MKKLLLLLFFIPLITMSFLSIDKSKEIKVEKVEIFKCKIRQCNAIAKSTGKRCKHCVSKKEDYQCYQHKPKN